MPAKLRMFVFVASASLLLTLLMGQWAPLTLTAVVLGAALEMRYEARSELLVIVRLAIALSLGIVLFGVASASTGNPDGWLTAAGGLVALLPIAFGRWCLDEVDVVRWMRRPLRGEPPAWSLVSADADPDGPRGDLERI